MNKNNLIISVGRQLGSGGHDVAKLLAQRFGCTFYDREILNIAAKESGFCEKFFEQTDEQKGFMKSLFHTHVPFVADNSFYNNNFSEESLFKFQSDAIRKAAEEGPCVFVGRCADYILRDHTALVSVFITADTNERISNVAKRDKCSLEAAKKIITSRESERSSYYNYYTGKQWGDSASYDICVNSSLLGLEGTVNLLAEFITHCLAAKGIDAPATKEEKR